jgi:aryl-alcohol dehydrogenase-like predicted oxidoreductase
MESCNASLKRLNTDYVDLYQAHRFDFETPLEETLGAFDDLIRSGKVLYIGFSEWNAQQIAAALKIQDQKGYYRFISSQPQYSMLWRVIESEVVPLSKQEGIGQIVWSPIAQGVLTGKYLPGGKIPAGSRATDKKGGKDMIASFMKEPILQAVQKLIPIAQKVDLTPAQLAVAWVLQNSNVSSAIIGATKPSQIKENVKAAGVKLDQSIMDEIDIALGSVVERDPAKTVSPRPRA